MPKPFAALVSATLLFVLSSNLEPQARGQTVAPPPAFQSLTAELKTALDAADGSLSALPVNAQAQSQRPLFSGDLPAASSHRGPTLLSPLTVVGTIRYLDSLVRLGVDSVTVNISYPILHEPFHGDPAEVDAYLRYYQRIFRHARARGLKIVVESQVVWRRAKPSAAFDVGAFYDGLLSLDDYVRGRIEVVTRIASELQPDYLSLQMEPDTEQVQTRQPMACRDVSVDVVRRMVAAIRATPGTEGVRLGAGVGTWKRDYRAWANALATSTGLDFLDMHIYPVAGGHFGRAMEIADIAHANGLEVGCTEAWLMKSAATEFAAAGAAPALAVAEFLRRDRYSFFEDLDRRFLESLTELAEKNGFAFVSPFHGNRYFAYLDYEQVKDWSFQYLLYREARIVDHAIRRGLTTGLVAAP